METFEVSVNVFGPGGKTKTRKLSVDVECETFLGTCTILKPDGTVTEASRPSVRVHLLKTRENGIEIKPSREERGGIYMSVEAFRLEAQGF